MKTTKKRNRFLSKPLFLAGMFSVVLALGVMVVGCASDEGDGGGPLEGTWRVKAAGDGRITQQLVFSGSSYTYSKEYAYAVAEAPVLLHEYEKGTFVYDTVKEELTLTPTSRDTTQTGNLGTVAPGPSTFKLTWGNASSFGIGGAYGGTYLK